ncbi:MAG: ClpXP protease specificity-enhancing factor [Gammaproteobacteria bacterium]|nr:ClpXP protease specificity-enhancing factor [Gammaproteobacteria bacterium]MDX5375718.1 ClpXP protease specificity-enhancing factor [Gammaproteobacteria bacterium]
MTSSRPYLLRAIYQWIVDNGLTPHILVNAEDEQVQVPRQYVEQGKIILNIAPMAVHGLTLGNEDVTFNARFGGTPMDIYVPMGRVLAIYARENGQGMMFGEEEDGDEPPPDDTGGDEPGSSRPHLKVVK